MTTPAKPAARKRQGIPRPKANTKSAPEPEFDDLAAYFGEIDTMVKQETADLNAVVIAHEQAVEENAAAKANFDANNKRIDDIIAHAEAGRRIISSREQMRRATFEAESDERSRVVTRLSDNLELVLSVDDKARRDEFFERPDERPAPEPRTYVPPTDQPSQDPSVGQPITPIQPQQTVSPRPTPTPEPVPVAANVAPVPVDPTVAQTVVMWPPNGYTYKVLKPFTTGTKFARVLTKVAFIVAAVWAVFAFRIDGEPPFAISEMVQTGFFQGLFGIVFGLIASYTVAVAVGLAVHLVYKWALKSNWSQRIRAWFSSIDQAASTTPVPVQ